MRRVLSVHFAPCALFVAGVLALIRAGSFSGHSDWGAVRPADPTAALALLTTITATAALLGLLLQPFQVRAIRALEGYWDRWTPTAHLAEVLIRLQRRRWRALHSRAHADGTQGGPATQRVSGDAQRRLAAQPPAEVLLPTALGNALRAGELSAGERYGLSTLSSWPRIYPQVSDRLAAALRSTRDALDTSVNLCWCFLALTLVGAVALIDEWSVCWWSGTGLVLAAVAYKGAVTTAQSYAGLMRVTYDLHRFDLLAALHHPLPADRDAEDDTFYRLSEFLAGTRVTDLPYDHGADDGGGAAPL
ncbi:hypothetical protein ACIPSJ_11135 [Streptomyces sp. NPDC090088]|uniref:hypothetical protein n=1 Tax=Streptomyces sp. NPDC090088 TaxID=3365944 RepID=UPI00381AD7BC